ncbi:MAG TPA: 50S ribosomal protein L10 [Acidimicrobiales bacterium]|jgi:large subunit ribosomal protein L10|nr:50S ribosomal protein L10 [Acidimicrobiales bacterium]
MSANRDAKTLVVDEVRTRMDESSATLVTEYRGLTVAEMAALRRALRSVGGDYKVFKNTLVRRAIEGSDHARLLELLEGPTAIAFVRGDVSAVAKALRDFSKGAPALIVRGGVLDGVLLDAAALGALAELPSRDMLLSMFAGALAAPMRTMAGLFKALPQNLAYGLAALVESKGGTRIEADAGSATSEDEAPSEQNEQSGVDDGTPPAAEAAAEAPAEAEGASDEAPAEPEVASEEAPEPEPDAPAASDAADATPSSTDDGAETPAS